MEEDKKALLRKIPGVDSLLSDRRLKEYTDKLPRSYVTDVVREVLDETRQRIQNGSLSILKIDDLISTVIKALERKDPRSLCRVINATGIILHTNLGRAVLSEKVRKAVDEIVKGYSNLEMDLETGSRGSRYSHVEKLLCKITNAESALVVNNNAAAVLLILNTLASGREVIVSRGQLVEIGGSFRIPDVMAASGAHLIEVGTTNKTYLSDYEKAITENTALLLKVHTSNFRVVGFTHETSSAELVKLGRQKGIPVFEDLGSGFLVDPEISGIFEEPTVKESLAAGIDIVSFSGDKLLGGPQAGIIVGKKEYLDRMKINPLTRALRVDKMTLAALEATLWEYLYEEDVIKTNPTLRMLTTDKDEIHHKASKLKDMLAEILQDKAVVNLKEDYSEAGGGSLPTKELPTYVVELSVKDFSAENFVARLRTASPPVVARIAENKVVFDPRTISAEEFPLIIQAVKHVFSL